MGDFLMFIKNFCLCYEVFYVRIMKKLQSRFKKMDEIKNVSVQGLTKPVWFFA